MCVREREGERERERECSFLPYLGPDLSFNTCRWRALFSPSGYWLFSQIDPALATSFPLSWLPK